MQVSYRYIRPCAVLYIRRGGAYAISAPAAWRRMSEWLHAEHIRHRVRRGIGVFHDDPTVTPPDALRYDACVVTEGATPELDPNSGVARQTLAGGAYAVHAYSGPYENAGQLFSRLRREKVTERGLSIDYGRPFVAVYLNDPRVARETFRRTEVCVPIVPIRLPRSTNDDEHRQDADAHAGTDIERFSA